MKRPKIPAGYAFSVDSIAVSLMDEAGLNRPMVFLSTEDEGGGAYLRLNLDADDKGIAINADELADLAGIGRWLVELHDALNSEAPDAGDEPANGHHTNG
jgi:hypothetical protein